MWAFLMVGVLLFLPGGVSAATREQVMERTLDRMERDREERAEVIEHTVANLRERFEISLGYRQDDFNWNIAGNSDGTGPNVLSELTWTDLRSIQLKARGIGTAYEQLYVRTVLAGGWIVDGENQDSDYSGDNRTGEFSRSNNASDHGWTMDASVGGGYQFRLLWDTLRLAPLGGYSMHFQNLTITDGQQTVGGSGPIHGLDSTYRARWQGPWAGVDASYRPMQKLALSGTFEYHWADYEAEANWNLRDDFAHPKSFEHLTDGTGIVISAGVRYAVSDRFSLHVDADLQDWSSDPGVDRTFFSNGSTAETRLNEVSWESFSIMLTGSYQW